VYSSSGSHFVLSLSLSVSVYASRCVSVHCLQDMKAITIKHSEELTSVKANADATVAQLSDQLQAVSTSASTAAAEHAVEVLVLTAAAESANEQKQAQGSNNCCLLPPMTVTMC
jgi:hypothetical protein